MKVKQFLTSPKATVVLFVLAAALLLGTTIGGTMAALTEETGFYTAGVELYNIGVSLIENDTAVEDGVLLKNLIPEGEVLKLGVPYKEALAVGNTGAIDEYVRVKVYVYWLDPKGKKTQSVDPETIGLHFVESGGWTIDKNSSTEERTILYYATPIAPDEKSTPFTDTLTIDSKIMDKATQTVSKNGAYTTITTTFDYDEYTFQIRAEVDAVQTHNADEAIQSAWGVSPASVGIQIQ